MTINKSQGRIFIHLFYNFVIMTWYSENCLSGQTMKYVGLWLRTPIFTHGQLYVACSRVGKPEHLKFAVKKQSDDTAERVQNVVFHEVLQDNS